MNKANKEFYEAFGKMVFAIAKADGKVHPEERRKIIQLVKHELAPFENVADEFGTDLAYYAEFSFEACVEFEEDIDGARKHFKKYVEKNRPILDNELLVTCKGILEKVADVYEGTNPLEQEIIEEFCDYMGVY